jgi:hypothetical protein
MAGRIVLYVLAWPRFLGWLFPLLAVALFLGHDLRILDGAVLACTWRPWLIAKGWRWSMTLAAGMCLHPAYEGRVLEHERVHVRQAEDSALGALPFAIIASIAGGSAWWMLLWPSLMLLQVGAFLGAVLRGGDVYRDAEHERSAYAQTDRRADGSSWLGDRAAR